MNKISWNLPVALELHTLRYPSTSTFLNPCIHQWNHISTMTYYKQFTRRLTSQHFYRLVKYLSWLQVIFPQNGSLHSSSSDFISQHTKGENLQYWILYTRHGIFVQSFKYFTRFMRSPCDLQYEYISRACYIAKEIHWYFEDKHFCLWLTREMVAVGKLEPLLVFEHHIIFHDTYLPSHKSIQPTPKITKIK